MFHIWQEKQDSKLDTVLSTISTQNEEIKASLSHLTQQYDEIKGKVEELIDTRRQELLYIKSLEDKIEVLEKKHVLLVWKLGTFRPALPSLQMN